MIQNIIEELVSKNIISNIERFEKLSGGTSSDIILIYTSEGKYILKLNEPEVIKSEVNFLKTYEHIKQFPNVIFSDDYFRYFLMEYMNENDFTNEIIDYEKILEQLFDITSQYEPSTIKGFGYMNDLFPSFNDFLISELELDRDVLSNIVDMTVIDEVVNELNKAQEPEETVKYVHGDFGIHNFIFSSMSEINIIDPTPMNNYVFYEMLFSYYSSLKFMSNENYQSLKQKYLQQYYISDDGFETYSKAILLLRIASCSRHHPEDLDGYIKYMNDLF